MFILFGLKTVQHPCPAVRPVASPAAEGLPGTLV